MFKRKKLALVLALIIMASFALTACGNDADKEEKVEDVDSKEEVSSEGKIFEGEELSVYVSFHEDMGKKLADMFEEETGAKVSYIRIPTGEAVTRMKAEGDSPNASVWIGGTADAHENLKKDGILEAYTSVNEADIAPEFKDPEGVWKGLYLETLSIGVNTDRLAEEFPGKEKPTKIEDLLDPDFAGEIITPDPNTSGTGYTFAASVVHALGEEKGYEFLEKIYGNTAQFTTSGFTPAEKVGAGEYMIALNFFADQLIVADSGYPMESTVYENAGWNVVPVSKIAGGKNSEVAEAFIDFTLTKEAADALVDLAHCVSVREDAKAPVGGKSITELPYDATFDPIGSAADKEEILEKISDFLNN